MYLTNWFPYNSCNYLYPLYVKTLNVCVCVWHQYFRLFPICDYSCFSCQKDWCVILIAILFRQNNCSIQGYVLRPQYRLCAGGFAYIDVGTWFYWSELDSETKIISQLPYIPTLPTIQHREQHKKQCMLQGVRLDNGIQPIWNVSGKDH